MLSYRNFALESAKERLYMTNLDPNKIYMLQVMLYDTPPTDAGFVPGNSLDETIEEHKTMYPEYKRIIIYDADTKEAVSIIRP